MALVILLIGGGLRLVEIGRPFPSSDHAEVAAIVTFFYPRDLAALSPWSERSTWKLLVNPHGIAPVALALPWVSALRLLGVPINEFWWNLLFALLGLCIIPLGYRLGVQLGGREAGWLCALFLAVLPVHASLSRGSGVAHIPLALLAQLWAVTAAQRYFENPTAQHMRRASLAIVLAVLTDLLLLPLFFLLLAVGLFSVRVAPATTSWRAVLGARLREARRLLFGTRLIVWPLVALAWPVGLLLLRAAQVIDNGGLLERLFVGSNRQAGVWGIDFVVNMAESVGPLALTALVVLTVAAIPGLLRFERRGFLLVWAGLYLGPFVLFSRPYVFEYYLLGSAPLVINAALVLTDGLRSTAAPHRVGASLVAALLVALLLVRAVTMISGVGLGPLTGTRQAGGAVFADPGIKAAAWWVRANAPADALVFADAPFEPYQLAYYLRQPFLARTDATSEQVFHLLKEAPRRPDYYLVAPGNEALLRTYATDNPQLAATVLVDGRPALLIYDHGTGTAQTITVNEGNTAFDREFGTVGR